MADKRRKPRGRIGPLVLGPDGAWEQIDLPDTKEEIEAWILDRTLQTAGDAAVDFYALTGEPVQNPEDDFDFTLPTKRGPEPLDLAEIAPLRAAGYEDAPGSYHVGKRADEVFELVAKKSEKYGRAKAEGPHLLLYSTDWRFAVGHPVLDLVAYYCARREHCLRSVVHFVPSADPEQGRFNIVFPRAPRSFEGFDEATCRARQLMIWDPRTAQFGTDEEGRHYAVVKLVPPPHPPR